MFSLQKAHWREHKSECSEPAEVAARLLAQAEQERTADTHLLEALEKEQAAEMLGLQQEELQQVHQLLKEQQAEKQQQLEEQQAELEAEVQAAEGEDGALDTGEAAVTVAQAVPASADENVPEQHNQQDSSNSTEVSICCSNLVLVICHAVLCPVFLLHPSVCVAAGCK